MTTEAKIAIEGLLENEKNIALEILKSVDGLEVSRADKILNFCKIISRNTAKTETKNLVFD